MASKRRRRTCPICEGAGKLTAEQEKRLKSLLDLAVWARELQKHVEAEEANQGLTAEDSKFLGDLGIGLEE